MRFHTDFCCKTSQMVYVAYTVDGIQSWCTGSKWKWFEWLQLMITCSGKHKLTLKVSDQAWYANTCHPLWYFHYGNFWAETFSWKSPEL